MTNSASEDTLVDAIARLMELHDLPPNWDSYGALPIDEKAEAITRRLLVSFWNAGLIPENGDFELFPGPDGGLQMEWTGPESELEIRVAPNGTYSIMQIFGRGNYKHPEWESHATADLMKGLIREVLQLKCPDRPRHCWDAGEICYEREEYAGMVSHSRFPPGPEEARKLERRHLPWWKKMLGG